jgi:hypothetical protein
VQDLATVNSLSRSGASDLNDSERARARDWQLSAGPPHSKAQPPASSQPTLYRSALPAFIQYTSEFIDALESSVGASPVFSLLLKECPDIALQTDEAALWTETHRLLDHIVRAISVDRATRRDNPAGGSFKPALRDVVEKAMGMVEEALPLNWGAAKASARLDALTTVRSEMDALMRGVFVFAASTPDVLPSRVVPIQATEWQPVEATSREETALIAGKLMEVIDASGAPLSRMSRVVIGVLLQGLAVELRVKQAKADEVANAPAKAKRRATANKKTK